VLPLLDHLFVRTGIDFRQYEARSIRRRLRHVMLQDRIPTVAALRKRLDDAAAARLLSERLCVSVTSMFRDPPFWQSFRTNVAPLLRKLAFVRIWDAGCATGEEAYSLAIVLREEGLYARSRIYATDVDEGALARARSGKYPAAQVREYTHNYLRAGGTVPFSNYYSSSVDGVTVRDRIRRNLVFARHNLVTDASFNEFHVVVCRNVMIYFGPAMQERVHELLWGSLAAGGVLALGLREIVPPHREHGRYERFDLAQKLYRRLGGLR
jgi:chemotaxis protein methyltransferase CheR